MRRSGLVRAVTLAASAVALACAPAVGATSTETGGIRGTNGAAVPALAWGECPAATPAEADALRPYRCATATVPLSYREPAGPQIALALGLLPAADQAHKIGTLFWNPGGPGNSGRIPPAFSEALHARFDIVGFDPRGIAASSPIRCFSSNQQALELLGWDGQDFPMTGRQERRFIDRTREASSLCARNAGPLLEHMATANVARDLDLLRQAVGDDQLSYFGISYGTHIGEVYANLFPENVRAVALDGVIDPVDWTTGDRDAHALAPFTYRLGNHRSAERALSTFLTFCAADARCAFREAGVDLRRKFDRLLTRLRRRPLELTGPDGAAFTVTYQLAVVQTLALLHDARASAELAATLQALHVASTQTSARPRVRTGVLDGLQEQGEPYAGLEWSKAVICTDTSNPRNPFAWPRYAHRADHEGTPFGSPFVYGSLPCATWPASDRDRYTGPWNRATAHPLLLVANRLGDPSAPYDGARRTADRLLSSARLLTVNSFGHTAFSQSSCVVRAVEHYLIEGGLPLQGAVCEPDRAPFDPVSER